MRARWPSTKPKWRRARRRPRRRARSPGKAAGAADRRAAADRSGQPDRRGVAHHAGGGRRLHQCYNAQAAVAAGSLLVVAVDVVQAPNDKQQVEPMLEKIGALPEGLGKVDHLLADTGYFSAGAVAACEKAGVEPVIAMGRQPHHPPLSERFAAAPEAPRDPTPVEAMALG